jgi:hypothetical protein
VVHPWTDDRERGSSDVIRVTSTMVVGSRCCRYLLCFSLVGLGVRRMRGHGSTPAGFFYS